jgi:hypothetical protein
MMAEGLMPNLPRVPFFLMLSLALLGGGCGEQEPVVGHMRVRYGDVWRELPLTGNTWFIPNEGKDPDLTLDIFPVFTFCGLDASAGEDHMDDWGSLCVHVDFESFGPGNKPEAYAIDGTVRVPGESRDETNNGVDFQPGSRHSAGLKEVWTRSGCVTDAPQEDVTQRVSGRFVVEENSKKRVRGHLELTVEGPTGGDCPGEAAEVELDFNLRY